MPPATAAAFGHLEQAEWLKKTNWYLAGGTAMALQVGHRISVDLDFFTTDSDFSPGILVEHFSKSDWETDIIREGTVYGRLSGAKISFIAYPFFLPSEPFIERGSLRILTIKDIAVMKMLAVSQRGKRRDFVDLYWLCQNGFSLLDILKKLPRQYPGVAHDYHHIIKALTYFDDAENDPMPQAFFEYHWPDVKTFFQEQAVQVANQVL